MISLIPAVLASACVFMVAAIASRGDSIVAARLGGSPARPAPAEELAFVSKVGRLHIVRRFAFSEGLERMRVASGRKISADRVGGTKALAAVCGMAIGLLLPGLGLAVAPLLALLGFRAPDILLQRAARSRLKAADSEIPQLLDLLAAGATAGLAGQLALVRACSGLRGPLADEIDASVRAVELGRRWRDELAALAERLGLPDLRRVVAVLTRTEVLGTPLTESLIDLAADVRSARAAAASERARKAPVKMLFPLVFLVLPAFLLLTVVPVFLSTIRSIS